MRMTTVHSAPPFDPECGATWRSVSEAMFEGRGPRVDAESLATIRGAELSTLDALLEGRAYSHRELQLPGPAGDLTLSVFTPDDLTGTAPGVYWVHGGGMVTGTRFGAAEAMNAGAAVGAVVTSIEYRLAPEHPAPAPVDVCYAGLLWVAEHAGELGIDRSRIVLGGASAGGGLAAATALRARDDGGPALAGLLLCCPMLDDRMTSCSSGQFDDAILWTRASNEFGWRSLLGERFGTEDVTIYDVPGRATDLSGLPPTLVDVGSADLFRDEDVAFASGIWAAGGDCELYVWSGGYHGFELIAPGSTLAQDAAAARRRWMARTLTKAG
jgi:acetyl esterase/lipase